MSAHKPAAVGPEVKNVQGDSAYVDQLRHCLSAVLEKYRSRRIVQGSDDAHRLNGELLPLMYVVGAFPTRWAIDEMVRQNDPTTTLPLPTPVPFRQVFRQTRELSGGTVLAATAADRLAAHARDSPAALRDLGYAPVVEFMEGELLPIVQDLFGDGTPPQYQSVSNWVASGVATGVSVMGSFVDAVPDVWRQQDQFEHDEEMLYQSADASEQVVKTVAALALSAQDETQRVLRPGGLTLRVDTSLLQVGSSDRHPLQYQTPLLDVMFDEETGATLGDVQQASRERTHRPRLGCVALTTMKDIGVPDSKSTNAISKLWEWVCVANRHGRHYEPQMAAFYRDLALQMGSLEEVRKGNRDGIYYYTDRLLRGQGSMVDFALRTELVNHENVVSLARNGTRLGDEMAQRASMGMPYDFAVEEPELETVQRVVRAEPYLDLPAAPQWDVEVGKTSHLLHGTRQRTPLVSTQDRKAADWESVGNEAPFSSELDELDVERDDDQRLGEVEAPSREEVAAATRDIKARRRWFGGRGLS